MPCIKVRDGQFSLYTIGKHILNNKKINHQTVKVVIYSRNVFEVIWIADMKRVTCGFRTCLQHYLDVFSINNCITRWKWWLFCIWTHKQLLQSNLDISNSDISNSAKLKASIWIKNTFWSLYPTTIWRLRRFYKSKLPEVQINLHFG